MKYLLIPFVLVAGNALACPADGAKDTMASADAKPAVATKTAATTAKSSQTPVAARTSAKPAIKVATKATAEPGKGASL